MRKFLFCSAILIAGYSSVQQTAEVNRTIAQVASPPRAITADACLLEVQKDLNFVAAVAERTDQGGLAERLIVAVKVAVKNGRVSDANRPRDLAEVLEELGREIYGVDKFCERIENTAIDGMTIVTCTSPLSIDPAITDNNAGFGQSQQIFKTFFRNEDFFYVKAEKYFTTGGEGDHPRVLGFSIESEYHVLDGELSKRDREAERDPHIRQFELKDVLGSGFSSFGFSPSRWTAKDKSTLANRLRSGSVLRKMQEMGELRVCKKGKFQ
ncbi:MAG: hypothetical protein COT74_11955 [Bdellovibrionales bacterium CG10_big_fil_rev_8_21_14_0_10_45_34]|nr:MAG: hypothetical protein COT74_11955 [Bdellovibrionales bacterium CG10_big_fil_rev_8_21_14_0_10_45_34]